MPDWCVKWCSTQHGKQLVSTAARLLVDLIGPDMGQLDQEMEKLAIYAGTAAKIRVIIVSSIDNPEDQARGLALGADAYIVKQRFEQRELLETIRQIL